MQLSSTYRALLSQLLLGFYVIGAVHAPVFEIIHFISHCIVDHPHDEMHFYADHTDTHSHKYLSVMDVSETDQEESERSSEPPTNKIEYVDQIETRYDGTKDRSPKLFDDTKPMIGIVVSIPSPPPKAIS